MSVSIRARDYRCPACGAEPGEICVKPDGGKYYPSHAARIGLWAHDPVMYPET